MNLSLVSVDSTVACPHHDAAGMVVDPAVLERWSRPPQLVGTSVEACDIGTVPAWRRPRWDAHTAV
ncbi:MAG: hypothetical protein HOV87_11645 [Catenulispora sp.]|nr:hypothetical protein [Catenulispora sp.]